MKCDNDSKCLNCFSYERLLRLTWDRNNNCTFISFVTSYILSHDSSVILCSFKREQSREKQFPPSLFNNFPDTKSTKDRMEYLNIWIGRRFDQSVSKIPYIVSSGIVHEENDILEQHWWDKLEDCTQYLHMKT